MTEMLTPLDTPIFDDDIVEEMDARVPLDCAFPDCQIEASVRVQIRCCDRGSYYCESHHAQERRNRAILLAITRTRCRGCDHSWAKGLEYLQVYSEMPL